jgi:ATP-dependent RNA helicase RhlE
MVRTIEKKLNAQIERRTIEGFDYSIPAPHKDSEFARPPQPPRNHAKKGTGKAAGSPRPDSAAKPRPHSAKPAPPSAAPAARHPQRAPRAR